MAGPEKTIIYFSPFWCSFGSPLPPEIEQGLYETLAFQNEGYYYSPAYQSHAWDGYTRLYHLTTRRFRVGMLIRVIQFLEEHDIEVEVLNRPPAKTFVQRSKTYALRPYQARAMADIVGQRFGILQAPMRSGKCVAGDTLILTGDGLVYPKELFEKVQLSNAKKTVFPFSMQICSLEGKAYTSHGYSEPVSEVVEIQLRSGLQLKCTLDHPINVFTEDLNSRFLSYNQGLHKGQNVCIPLKTHLFGQNLALPEAPDDECLLSRRKTRKVQKFPSKLSLQLCRLLAYIIAEGYTMNARGVTVSNKDLLLVQDLKEGMKNVFGLSAHKVSKLDYRFSSRDIRDYLLELGIGYSRSKDKCIPLIIRSAPKRHVREFLRALFECEGCVTDRSVEIDSASKQLLSEVQLLLLNFGIVSKQSSTLTLATNGARIERRYYRLLISHSFVSVFAKEIGFLYPRKQKKLVRIMEKVGKKGNNCDLIPYVGEKLISRKGELLKALDRGDPIRKKLDQLVRWPATLHKGWQKGLSKFAMGTLKEIVEERPLLRPLCEDILNVKQDYFYDEIVSIRKRKPIFGCMVYDFVVPTSHSFVANGILNHNTMLYIATIDSENEFPSVFFCRSLDLAYQTLERLGQFLPNVKAGLVGDNKIDIQDVTVITIQSAFSAYKKKCDEKDLPEEKDIKDDENKSKVRNLLQQAKIVFYDEFHHAQSKTSRFILDKCVHATMKIGLSATPFTGEASDLLTEEIAGPVIHKISYSELIDEGFLLRPFIYMYTLPEIKIPKDTPYPTVYKMAVTDNDYLTGLIKKLVDTLTDMGKSVVVQTEFISHTKKLADALGSASLTGKERDMNHRVKVKKQLENKEILCLVSTLFEEGLDVPTLDYTINAAGGLSNIGTLQRMRSITGNVKGKTTCGIIDFFHQCKYLERHSKVRQAMYQSEPEFVLEERDVSDLSLEEVE